MGIESVFDIGSGIASGIGALTGGSDQTDMANQLYGQVKYKPYNVNSPLGSATFDGNNGAFGQLSPEFQQALMEAQGNRTNLASLASKFSLSDYANQYYKNLKQLQAPEQAWSGNDFLDKVYQSGGWGGTTGAHDIWSYANLQNQQDIGLRQQALASAGQEQTRLYNTYLNQLKAEMVVAGIPNDLITQGGQLGSYASSANNQAAQYPWQAAQNNADATSAFWGNLGGGVGSAAYGLYNKYGSPGTGANSWKGFGGFGMSAGDILSGWSPTGSGGGW